MVLKKKKKEISINRSSFRDVFYKNGILKTFTKITKKTLVSESLSK